MRGISHAVNMIGLGASIIVDGEPLIEYADPGSHDNKQGRPQITRYIEAQEGSMFQVKIHVQREFDFRSADHLGVDFYVDGEVRDDTIVERADCEHGDFKWTLKGSRFRKGSYWLLKKFCFGRVEHCLNPFSLRFRQKPLTLADDSVVAKEAATPTNQSDVGTIKVVFWRKKYFQDRSGFDDNSADHETIGDDDDGDNDNNDSEANQTSVPEKLVKGKAVYISAR